jgi:hypothetical protein
MTTTKPTPQARKLMGDGKGDDPRIAYGKQLAVIWGTVMSDISNTIPPAGC